MHCAHVMNLIRRSELLCIGAALQGHYRTLPRLLVALNWTVNLLHLETVIFIRSIVVEAMIFVFDNFVVLVRLLFSFKKLAC